MYIDYFINDTDFEQSQRSYFIYFFLDTNKREKGESYVRYFKRKPIKTELDHNIQLIEKTSDEEVVLWDKKIYTAKCTYKKNSYSLNIDIPWEKLKMIPFKGMELLFDIHIIASDGSNFTELSLNNTGFNWYDLVSYAKIDLI